MSSTRSHPSASARSSSDLMRAVVVLPEHLRPLQKFAPVDTGLEILARDEEVILAVPLLPSRRPRRVRDRKAQPGNALHQLVHQRGFPRPDGAEMMKTVVIPDFPESF